MLSSLHIENIAVIKSADIDLGSGFNVLTGETGAGKSILIDSINLILGAKPSKDMIRNGESKAEVSALFSDIQEPLKRAAELEISTDEDGCLYITREIYADGKAKTKLNGRAIPASLQKELLAYLISIHGQNDNRILMSPSAHLEYLDGYAGNGVLLNEYFEYYELMTDCRKKITELTGDEREKARTAELLKYQIADIDAAKLKFNEEQELEIKRDRVKNAEKIMKQTRLITRVLYRNERSLPAYELVKKAIAAIEGISDYIPNAEEYINKLNDISYTLEDIGLTVEDISDTEYEDPDKELDKIESRLELISKLERKYGSDIPEILAYRERAVSELSEIELSDIKLADLAKQLEEYEKKAYLLAVRLSDSRKLAAKQLEKSVIDELAYLEMPKVRFKIDIKKSHSADGKIRFTRSGIDDVEFLLSANPGEPLKPLAKIASGGELSRIMLALKSVNAADASGETLIFDEIDTGVSGKTSQKIGMRLRALASANQVICVTHSAQIAAEAHHQYLIRKNEKDGRVETSVTELDREGRIKEIARIMGGVNITDKLLDSAAEMLDSADND